MVKIIDLSVPLSTKGNLNDQPAIEYRTHKQTAEMAAENYGIEADDFRNGQYAAIETITLTTHATSHMDAPYHFAPTSEGKPAKTIDQIPKPFGFKVAAFPINIEGASGAWVRAVAILEE
ncbi:MAG: cyclase family protein [Desulfobacteraceae bacterium]|nr:cyclase family protein [Desulfobacteraceae bacterium]